MGQCPHGAAPAPAVPAGGAAGTTPSMAQPLADVPGNEQPAPSGPQLAADGAAPAPAMPVFSLPSIENLVLQSKPAFEAVVLTLTPSQLQVLRARMCMVLLLLVEEARPLTWQNWVCEACVLQPFGFSALLRPPPWHPCIPQAFMQAFTTLGWQGVLLTIAGAFDVALLELWDM